MYIPEYDFDRHFWEMQNGMMQRIRDGVSTIMLENAALKDKIKMLEDKIDLQEQIIKFQADYIKKGDKIDYTLDC